MQIDLFHDTACPWCRIGKANLESALVKWSGEPINVEYRTFFLNANIPAEGHDFESYMLAKGNHQMSLEGFFDGPRRAGQAAGLTFNFEQITKAPNTERSHRLIALAPDDAKSRVADALYDAYFEHARDIGDLDVLVEIADACGLDGDDVRRQLEGDAAREQVLAEAQWAQQNGISGVPFFVIDGRYGLSGAQTADAILSVMQQAQQAEKT